MEREHLNIIRREFYWFKGELKKSLEQSKRCEVAYSYFVVLPKNILYYYF